MRETDNATRCTDPHPTIFVFFIQPAPVQSRSYFLTFFSLPSHQEKEGGGDENGFLWVAAKLEHLVRCNAKVLVHPRSGAANATGVLSRILAKTAEAKERGPVKKKRKKKRKRPQQAEDALEDPGSTPVGDKDDGGEGAQAAEEDPLDVICSARYCQRFFPIQALCKFEAASLEAGLGAASTSFLRGDVAEGRKLPAKSPLKFAVWCKQRKLKVGEEGRRVVDLLSEAFKAHCEGAGIEAQVSLRDPQVLVLAEAPFEASGGQKLIALCVLPSGCVDIKPKGVMVKTLFDKADL